MWLKIGRRFFGGAAYIFGGEFMAEWSYSYNNIRIDNRADDLILIISSNDGVVKKVWVEFVSDEEDEE